MTYCYEKRVLSHVKIIICLLFIIIYRSKLFSVKISSVWILFASTVYFRTLIVNFSRIRSTKRLFDVKSMFNIQHTLCISRAAFWRANIHRTDICIPEREKVQKFSGRYEEIDGEGNQNKIVWGPRSHGSDLGSKRVAHLRRSI